MAAPILVLKPISPLQAAMNSLDDDMKRDYLISAREVPTVVDQESNPSWFLEHAGNDVDDAAKCLALHWKMRRQAFGDRFLLPILNLTGQGALPRDALELMNRGAQYTLPVDDEGRFVLVNDLRVYEHQVAETKPHYLQTLWYFLILASMSPKTRVKGAIALRISNNFSLDEDRLKSDANLIGSAMPFSMHECRICVYVPKSAQRTFQQQVAALKYFCDTVTMPVVFRMASSPPEMLVQMQQDGLHASNLSQAFGGLWDSSPFMNQLRNTFRDRPHKLQETIVVQEDGTSFLKLAELCHKSLEDDRRARKRAKDVEYARKRRQKEKDQEKAAQDQCILLHRENTRLVEESRRLQDLVRHAERLVAEVAGFPQPQSVSLTCSESNPTTSLLHGLLSSLLQGASPPRPVAPPPSFPKPALPPPSTQRLTTSPVSQSIRPQSRLQPLLSPPQTCSTPREATASKPRSEPMTLLEAAFLRLDDEMKRDYLIAVKEVPNIVEQESNPSWFLVHRKNDADAAAKSLAMHWKFRRQAFGDRFLLPILDLGGQGALSPERLEVLCQGAHYVLPADDEGHFIAVNDQRVYEPNIGQFKPQRLQSLWYIFVLASMDARTRQNGFIGMRIANGFPLDKERVALISKLIREAMPFSLREMRLCSYAPKAAQRVFKQQAPAIKYFCDTVGAPVAFHMVSCQQEMLACLQQKGLHASKLSPAFGGTWDPSLFLDQIQRWIQEHQRTHQKSVTVHVHGASFLKHTEPFVMHTLEDERSARKRDKDVKYAHERCKKEKEVERAARDQCIALRRENTRLVEESRRLEELLHQAKRWVVDAARPMAQPPIVSGFAISPVQDPTMNLLHGFLSMISRAPPPRPSPAATPLNLQQQLVSLLNQLACPQPQGTSCSRSSNDAPSSAIADVLAALLVGNPRAQAPVAPQQHRSLPPPRTLLNSLLTHIPAQTTTPSPPPDDIVELLVRLRDSATRK